MGSGQVKGQNIIEVFAEFFVIFGVGATFTYLLRGGLDGPSLLKVAIIGLFVLYIDEYRKEK
ncbi:MAG: hypothetical protein P1P80_06895 [ANME-2 cluster archaeon]|nr:hypothetical protein [ANME-2 cluster archaeon]